jgi:hypothetical protein
MERGKQFLQYSEQLHNLLLQGDEDGQLAD